MRRLAILILTYSLSAKAGFCQLSGIYTIGGSNADFSTIGSAVEALNGQGVNGATIFKIRTGTYSDVFKLNYVKGSSILNTITFEPESGKSGDVILNDVGLKNQPAILDFEDASFIRIRGINAISSNMYAINDTRGEHDRITQCQFIDSSSQIYDPFIWISELTNSTMDSNLIKTTRGSSMDIAGEFAFNNITCSDLVISGHDLPVFNNKFNVGGFTVGGYGGNVTGMVLMYDTLTASDNVPSTIGWNSLTLINCLITCSQLDINASNGGEISNCVIDVQQALNFYGNSVYLEKNDIQGTGYFNYCTKSIFSDNQFSGSVSFAFCQHLNIYSNAFNALLESAFSDYIDFYNNFIEGNAIFTYADFCNIYNNNIYCVTGLYNSILGYETNVIDNNFNTASNFDNEGSTGEGEFNNYYPYKDTIESHSFHIDPKYDDTLHGNLHITNYELRGKGTNFNNLQLDVDSDTRDTAFVTIGADELCLPSLFTIQSLQTMTCGDSLMLQPTYNHNASYSWSPQIAINNVHSARPKISPTKTTTYFVTAFDSCGLFQDSVKVIVNPLKINAGSDRSINCGEVVHLHATDLGSAEYSWQPANLLESPSMSQSLTVPLSSSTVFTITATAPGCGTASDSVDVNVNTVPTVSFTISKYDVNCIKITNSSSYPASYYWNFGDGYVMHSLDQDFPDLYCYSPPVSSSNISLTVINPCNDSVTGVQYMDFTGLPNPAYSKFKVFPDPAHDWITVSVGDSLSNHYQIRILDMLGHVYTTSESDIKSSKIDLRGIPDGIYIIEISAGNFIAEKKLIIE